MKPVVNLALSAMLSVLLVACGSKLNQENFEQITNGMTREEVVKLLGEPQENSGASALGISGGQAKWSDGKTEVTVQFLNDKVVSKQLSTLSPPKS